MDYNDYVQMAAVAVLLVICIVWTVRRIRRRKTDSCDIDNECTGCSLAEHCKKAPKKKS